jgi:ABC-type nitrate/sulfonate/bicarbonate transport system substrate-binding protein
MKMKRLFTIFLSLLLVLAASGCGGPSEEELTPVTVMLDWVPNTNHTGIFVARSQGYFKEAGLEVKIIQPGEVYPEAAVAGGVADFGVSFQDSLTLARANKAPIVSIAAILQHNTSGFASLASRNIKSPKDFEGLTYGAFGSPFEEPTLKRLMESQGGDYSRLKIQNIGFFRPAAPAPGRQDRSGLDFLRLGGDSGRAAGN